MALDSLAVIVPLVAVVAMARVLMPNRSTIAIFLVAIIGAMFVLCRSHRAEISQGWNEVRASFSTVVQTDKAVAFPDGIQWPPAIDEPYPDLILIDQDGKRTSLSEFKGKVILLEPVGMPCRACVAFAGGHECGEFEGVAPQEGLQSIDHYVTQYGNVNLDDERIVLVQVLFYSKSLKAPTPKDGRNWAEHFGMDRSNNEVVLVAEPNLLSQATYDMIPGFQLIDKDFVLRCDSAGHHPRHNLFTELLPRIRELLDE